MTHRAFFTFRRSAALLVVCVSCALSGCGGAAPALRPVDVTETWTSGDDEALGLADPPATDTPPSEPTR